MSFVISLTLLTIVIDAKTGNDLISSWFGMEYSKPGANQIITSYSIIYYGEKGETNHEKHCSTRP